MQRTICARTIVLAAVLVFVTIPVSAQVPDEVQGLGWCPAAKDCLSWAAVGDAASYNLYSGRSQDLSGLLDGSTDSCAVGTFPVTTTGAMLGDPGSGKLDWYLVTAANGMGEGSAGAGSGGTRVLNSSGPCVAATGPVINETDYDQPGTDFGEFVEIFTPDDLDLTDVVVIFVNGLSSSEYARVQLSDAGSLLPAGDFLVVGTPSVVASLPAGTLSVTLGTSNNMQNGAPDGIALFDTGTQTLLDALSYEGSITAATFDGVPGTFNLVEGTAATAQDSNSVAGSLIRFRDGADTDQADNDWHFVATPTPGTPNSAP